MQGDENITQQKKVDEDIFFCEGKNNNNKWIKYMGRWIPKTESFSLGSTAHPNKK